MYESAIAHELRTGYSSNGTSSDLTININAYNLRYLYIDDNPYDGAGGIASNQYDLTGLMVHEIGHGLGFYADRDDTTGAYFYYKSVWDDRIQMVGSQPYFVGENVSRYYGNSVPLTRGDLSHVGNGSDVGSDLWNSMMAPYITPGVRFGVTSLEKAMLADMGIGTNQSDILKVHFENTGRSVTLDAGAGTDTIVYYGNRSSYTVYYAASVGGYVVKGNGFTDTLRSAEQIRFDNGTFWVEDLADMTTGVHRFYNTATNTHFFTGSNAEAYKLRATAPQFIDEGFAFANTNATGGLDVFRFLNKETGAFFYTISTQERDNIRNSLPLFEYQSSSFKALTSDRGPQEELYRFYNSATNSHFFTVSESERDTIIATLPTFKYEGVAFYVDVLG
ncbi:hypothetical protein VZ95_20530 [Elstera litoralis]|uniref:DUF5648 domain-containing protein n=3 Tax=Elstera litoralis TaxID=552518 RepID=A0A0F3IJ55_9PROT|nr:hypothetical protein VZ95_20530 [Elstera litoralis]